MVKLFKNNKTVGYIFEMLLIALLSLGGMFLLWAGYGGAVDFSVYENARIFKIVYLCIAVGMVSIGTYFISYKIPNWVFPIFTFIAMLGVIFMVGGSLAFNVAYDSGSGLNSNNYWIGFDIIGDLNAIATGMNVKLIVQSCVYGAVGIFLIIGFAMIYYSDSSGETVKVILEMACVLGGAVVFAQYIAPTMI